MDTTYVFRRESPNTRPSLRDGCLTRRLDRNMEDDPSGPNNTFDMMPEQEVAHRSGQKAEEEQRQQESLEQQDAEHAIDIAVLARTVIPDLAAHTARRMMCLHDPEFDYADSIPVATEQLRRWARVRITRLEAWHVTDIEESFIYLGRDGQLYGSWMDRRRRLFFSKADLENLHYRDLCEIKEKLNRLWRGFEDEVDETAQSAQSAQTNQQLSD